MAKIIELTKAHYDALVQQAQSDYPLETCGLLAGKDNRVQQLYPIENIRRSPVEYELDPVKQLAAMLDMEEKGWDLLAIYHSHPRGPQSPSAMDIDQAYYPDAAYMIVSLADRHRPKLRAFSIVLGDVKEIALHVV